MGPQEVADDCNFDNKGVSISLCAFFNCLLCMVELNKIYRRGDSNGVNIMAGGD